MTDQAKHPIWIPEIIVDYFTQIAIEDYWGQDGVDNEDKLETLVQANVDAFCLLDDAQKLEIYQDAAHYLDDAHSIALAQELSSHLPTHDWENAFEKAAQSPAMADFALSQQHILRTKQHERAIALYLVAVLDEANQHNTVSHERMLQAAEQLASRITSTEPQPASLVEKVVLQALDLKALGQRPEQHFATLSREAQQYAAQSFERLYSFVHHQILEERMVDAGTLAALEESTDHDLQDGLHQELRAIDVAAAKLTQQIVGLEPPSFTPQEWEHYIEPLGLTHEHEWTLQETVDVVNNGAHFAHMDFDLWAKANDVLPEIIAEVEGSVLESLIEDGWEIDQDFE